MIAEKDLIELINYLKYSKTENFHSKILSNLQTFSFNSKSSGLYLHVRPEFMPFGDRHRLGDAEHLRADDRELVATQAAERVVGSEAILDPDRFGTDRHTESE